MQLEFLIRSLQLKYFGVSEHRAAPGPPASHVLKELDSKGNFSLLC